MTPEQIQEIPQSIQPVQQVPVEPKKKLSLSTVAILLVAIVLIGAGGIYAVKRLSQPRACTLEVKLCPDGSAVGRTGPNCEFAPCPTEISSATPTPNETANWKTYKDAESTFSINYPTTWVETDSKNGVSNNSSPYATATDEGYKLLKKGIIYIRLGPIIREVKNLDDWFSATIDEYKKMEGDPPYRSYKSKSEVTVRDYKALKVIAEGYGGLNYTDYFIFDPVKSRGVPISIMYPYDEINEQELLIDQILSTFKFLP